MRACCSRGKGGVRRCRRLAHASVCLCEFSSAGCPAQRHAGVNYLDVKREYRNGEQFFLHVKHADLITSIQKFCSATTNFTCIFIYCFNPLCFCYIHHFATILSYLYKKYTRFFRVKLRVFFIVWPVVQFIHR